MPADTTGSGNASNPNQNAGGGAVGAGIAGGPGGANRDVPDDRTRQIQQQLMLLLHAHKCNRIQNLNPNREVCNVNFCKAMKSLLAHMVTCNQSKDCTMQHCASSRQILLHYKTCTNSACIICYRFRPNYNYQNYQQMQMQQQEISRLASDLSNNCYIDR